MSSPSITPSTAQLKQGANQTTSQANIKRRARNNTLVFWGFVGPFSLGLLIFVYIPILWAIFLSFANAQNTIFPTAFSGIQNYVTVLQDSEFLKSLLTFTVFAIFIVPLTFFASLGLALLVNSINFGKGFFRSVFFIPTACSYVVASLVWKMSIFNGLPYGLANLVLGIFHHAPIAWVSTPTPPWYWLVLVTVRLWLQLGFYMIIFIAGLQDIPRELYEAANVDGAKKGWTTFRYITFPMLRNTSVAVLLLTTIAAFQAFDEFYNVMGSFVGSSGNAILARPPLVYLYSIAFGNQNYGVGSAGAIILTIIIIVFTFIQGRFVGFGKEQ